MVHNIGWQSSRIQRVVKSTLAAEAYSLSDAVDSLHWARAVLTEILYPELSGRAALDDSVIQCAAVTDCKSLYDTITKERVMLTDKRLSLEASLLRQSLSDVSIKWVKSEQMLADCLTKVLPGSYARMVFDSCSWTLGPDKRAPSLRNRKLNTPGKVANDSEAAKLNEDMESFITVLRGSSLAEFDTDVSTFSAEVIDDDSVAEPSGWSDCQFRASGQCNSQFRVSGQCCSLSYAKPYRAPQPNLSITMSSTRRTCKQRAVAKILSVVAMLPTISSGLGMSLLWLVIAWMFVPPPRVEYIPRDVIVHVDRDPYILGYVAITVVINLVVTWLAMKLFRTAPSQPTEQSDIVTEQRAQATLVPVTPYHRLNLQGGHMNQHHAHEIIGLLCMTVSDEGKHKGKIFAYVAARDAQYGRYLAGRSTLGPIYKLFLTYLYLKQATGQL